MKDLFPERGLAHRHVMLRAQAASCTKPPPGTPRGIRTPTRMTCGNIGVYVVVELRREEGKKPPWMVPDGLWERIEPLLPVVPRRADHPGRTRLDDRKVLCGILFVLYMGFRGSSCRRSWASGPG